MDLVLTTKSHPFLATEARKPAATSGGVAASARGAAAATDGGAASAMGAKENGRKVG